VDAPRSADTWKFEAAIFPVVLFCVVLLKVSTRPQKGQDDLMIPVWRGWSMVNGQSSKNMSSKKALSNPLTYLIVQEILILAFLTRIHGIRGEIVGDWRAYINFDWGSFGALLSQTRTFGYPLLLRVVGGLFDDLTLLPQVQILLFLISVLLFYQSLTVYGFSKWGAFVAASALIYQRTLWDLAAGTYSDVPGLSFAFIAIASLFRIAAGKGSVGSWFGVAVGTFLAYQMRPAYLFLIGLVPVLGVILSLVREPGVHGLSRGWRKLFACLLIASIVPFLAFASFRLMVVGHFGLVSYGSLMLSGITTQFMTKPMVERFDADLRPLATAIIESRDRNGLAPPEGHRMWPLVDYCAIFARTLTHVVIPTTLKHLPEVGPRDESEARAVSSITTAESMPLDDVSRRLAVATIRARPFAYLLYCVKSFAYQISFTLYVNATISLLFLGLFAAHLYVALQESIVPTRSQVAFACEVQPPTENVGPLVFLSGLFFLANVLLITIAAPPDGRYLLAASAFIPSALAVGLWQEVRRACLVSRRPPDIT
jgi:hypothetical protein